MTNLSQIFLQNNLALYILSNKNFFLPSLVTYRAVRDLISETKKFANSEDLRFHAVGMRDGNGLVYCTWVTPQKAHIGDYLQ